MSDHSLPSHAQYRQFRLNLHAAAVAIVVSEGAEARAAVADITAYLRGHCADCGTALKAAGGECPRCGTEQELARGRHAQHA